MRYLYIVTPYNISSSSNSVRRSRVAFDQRLSLSCLMNPLKGLMVRACAGRVDGCRTLSSLRDTSPVLSLVDVLIKRVRSSRNW